jgi:hypothetical protein
MAPPGDHDDRIDALPAREAARVRHRDRKRRTAMVVDNAGVKRILLARQRRSTSNEPPTTPPPTAPE